MRLTDLQREERRFREFASFLRDLVKELNDLSVGGSRRPGRGEEGRDGPDGAGLLRSHLHGRDPDLERGVQGEAQEGRQQDDNPHRPGQRGPSPRGAIREVPLPRGRHGVAGSEDGGSPRRPGGYSCTSRTSAGSPSAGSACPTWDKGLNKGQLAQPQFSSETLTS